MKGFTQSRDLQKSKPGISVVEMKRTKLIQFFFEETSSLVSELHYPTEFRSFSEEVFGFGALISCA